MTSTSNRIIAIDIFRALTMLLMIFVNDLWTLTGVPEWMEHAKTGEDRMGLSDWVFPGFLFIVGLSIPHAIDARRKKGDSTTRLLWQIFKRTLALVIMGFFMVNLENINREALMIPKYLWQLLMATAIVLIWNLYPDKKAFRKIPQWVMQIIGILVLIYLAIIYKGGSAENITWMKPRWWGILGIIGWSYVVGAIAYLLAGKRILLMVAITVVFYILNAFEFLRPFGNDFTLKIMVSSAHHACVLTGILITILYKDLVIKDKQDRFLFIILSIAAILMFYGILTRPEWGISKLRATPSWTSICNSISIATFGLLYIITDLYKRTSWANWVSPAGRSTLTCYLVPYFYYAVLVMVGIYLPDYLKAGYIGIIKSLLFAWLIVFITGLLEKIQIKLKV